MTPRERDVVKAIIKALSSRDYTDMRAYALSYDVSQRGDRLTIARELLIALCKKEKNASTSLLVK